MRVLGLRLVNFRSYCDTAVDFGPGTTVVVGANATGKTNLLEGAFFGLRGSSPRTRSDDKLITWGEPFTRVTVTLEDDEGERHTCEVAYAPRQGRRVRYDGVEVAGLDDLRRRSMVFIFVPESLLLVKGSPARRRAHLDVFAAAIDPAYAAALSQLTLALRQRNAQLVAVRDGADPAALAPWDAQFAAAATELDRRRRAVVTRLARRFAAAAEALAPGGGRYTIELVAQTDAVLGADGVADERALLEELRRRRPGEVQRGLSLFGPQRDDLRFLELPDHEGTGPTLTGPGCAVDGRAAVPAGGRDLRLYGSQGEQRAAVLALLLAEREVAAESGAGTGALFLDDVMSELDDARRRRLVDLLSRGGQAILTTTNRHYFTEDELGRALVVELPLAGERLGPPPVAGPTDPPEDEL